MSTLIVRVDSVPSDALREMVVAALRAECGRRAVELRVTGPGDADASAPALLVSSRPETAPGDAARVASPADVIRHTRRIVAELLGDEAPATVEAPAREAPPRRQRVVAVTACPTGIAHTFMAAEALRRAGAQLGVDIHVETRGSVGAQNLMTAEQIAAADAVIIAADTGVDKARFAGKRVFETGTKAALRDGPGVMKAALALPDPTPGTAAAAAAAPASRPAADAKGRVGVYKHLMSGVSHMLPLVVAGGLMIALAFTVGGINAGEAKGTLGEALMRTGASAAFALMVPVLAGFIAFSIADRPGLAPGLVGGMLASLGGAGFLGGLVAGFLAGYVTRFLNDKIRLPDTLAGLKPVLILPLLSTLVVGLSMVYLIGPPVAATMTALTDFLRGMQSGSAVLLGMFLGAMMAFDMGGPVNKAAYTFAVGLLATKVYGPMAAVMAAGMTPPLGLALAATLFPDRFTETERKTSKPTAILGLSFITEGAIPFAAADPLRVIPALILGSATAGALALGLGVHLTVPHGGGFVLLIPNALTPLLSFVAAVAAGTVVTTLSLRVAKRRAGEPRAATAPVTTTAASAAALLAVVLLSAPAFADDQPKLATGVWYGARDTLADAGVEVFAKYDYIMSTVAAGGLGDDSGFTGDLFFGAALDLDKAFGWPGARFTVSGLNRHGTSVDEQVGGVYSVMQNFGGQSTFLYNVTLEQKLLAGALSIKAGRMTATDDFAGSPLFSRYLNNSIDGQIRAVLFDGVMTSYPFAVWGARVRAELPGEVYAMAGVFQLSDRMWDPDRHGKSFTIESGDGVSLFTQVGWTPKLGARGLGGHYYVGSNAAFFDVPRFSGGTSPRLFRLYAHAAQEVYREPDSAGDGLTVFATLAYAPDDEVAKLPFQTSLGAQYAGLLPGRDADRAIFGFTYGRLSPAYSDARVAQGEAAVDHEMMLELGYRVQFTDYLYAQPDVQLVVNPGGTGQIDDAVVAGMQWGIVL